MGSETKLRHADKWRGQHRGISIEVSRHGMSRSFEGGGEYDVWCYYLSLHEKQVPEEKQPAFFLPHVIKPLTPGGREWLTHDYYESAFADLETWHGGITYYEYLCEVPGFRIVQAGCDWNHYWDHAEDARFDLRHVEFECRRTVDELWEKHPDLLVHCGYHGGYYPMSECEPWGDGFISKEGKAKLLAALRSKVGRNG